MSSIRRLDSRTIDRIAAGEVVARPASAIKELVENALDAGARRIEVEIEGGGVGRLRVRDDGAGMSRDDARLAVERHATSKIRTEKDLADVATFGFRGEALPSIAAVSEFSMVTNDGPGPEGTRVEISFGAAARVSPAAFPRGTEVVAARLFEKVPARRKFLKAPAAETREALRAVTRAALGNPGVAFHLAADGREVLSLPAATGRAARLSDLFGDETGPLIPFEARSGGLALSGFVSRGSATFASRRLQYVFVNGRPVEDRGVARAIRDGSREAIRTDRHPAVFLFLTVSEGGVDVNVSPAKTEVRFAQPSDVYRLVFHGLLSALVSGKEERRLVPVPQNDFSVAEAREIYAAPPSRPPSGSPPVKVDVGGASTAPAEPPPPVPSVLGQYDDSFIVAEAREGLLLIDQHAAHERVLFEKLLDRTLAGRGFSQPLLTPAQVALGPEQSLAVTENQELLAELGFDAESMSGGVVFVRAVPAESAGRDPAELLGALLDALAAGPQELPSRRERLAATIACRSAITIHHRLSRDEIVRLISDWIRCRDRFTCPHGRPIVLTLSDDDLAKFFKRK